MLKRYLANAYGITPDQYRQRWGAAEGIPDGGPELRREAHLAG
nr:MucR family transcriptional regulator [Gluconobacter sphaericus]